ncbi:hypothetical protein C0993_007484 [Termitomyces sp. T159_Od127]|nr:hypothetical protein C0993_007484 [Termitomyces sp. T159_Od127]
MSPAAEQGGYLDHTHREPAILICVERRVELLRKLPQVPATKPPPAAVKVGPRERLATAAKEAVKEKDTSPADVVMKDGTRLDPKLVKAKLTKYRDEEATPLGAQVGQFNDMDVEGEDED